MPSVEILYFPTVTITIGRTSEGSLSAADTSESFIGILESNDELIAGCHCWLAQQCDLTFGRRIRDRAGNRAE